MLRGLRRRALDWPSTLAWHAVSLPPVARWRHRRYLARLDRFRAQSAPCALCRSVAAELEDRGVATLPAGAPHVPDVAAILDAGRRALASHAAALAAAARTRDFVIVAPAEIARYPEIYRFGLDERLLDIVETYLGQPVAYDGVAIHYTPADGREAATRMWHRDREDRRMVKLFVYLNDVDADGGPFELLPVAPPYPLPAARRDSFVLSAAEQESVAASRPDRPVVQCVSPAGAMILADTARFFHRGRPAVARDRAALFFSYFAARPQHPFFCDRAGLTRQLVQALSRPLTRRQQEAARWRQRLPLGWRVIPPARI